MKTEIVIAQRGWVFVGSVTEDHNKVTITNAKNIRRWGTTKGLGEIALNGPTGNTVLDPVGTVNLHPLTIVARIDCDPDKWKV
jgi:hypothetical protein